MKKPLAISSFEDFWLVPGEGCRTKKAPTPTLQMSYSDLTRNFSLFVCHSLHGGMGVGLGFEPPFLFLGGGVNAESSCMCVGARTCPRVWTGGSKD